ncbi:MAG: hypothetical protein H0U57_04135 [Tatlockia sp.]|nr:hypothetical protein [Tatlockia sp.]
MRTKNCQMVVAGDFRVALEKSKIKATFAVTQADLEEGGVIQRDIGSSCLIDQEKKFNVLENIWLNEYQHGEKNEYNQGRIEGSFIPGTKMTTLMMYLQFTLAMDIASAERLSFSYFDDNNNPCGFTLTICRDCPSIWFAAITVNTPAPVDQRQVSIFIPEFSPELFDTTSLANKIPVALEKKNISREEFENQIKDQVEMNEPLVFNMQLLGEHFGFALNNLFIQNALANLFDAQGNIQLNEFDLLSNSIKSKSSMFDLPDEKIKEFSNRVELCQLLATLTKIKNSSETTTLDNTISLINKTMNNYTPERFAELKQNNFILRFQNSSSQLNSREVQEILCPTLFPKDNFELQNTRLTYLLAANPASPLKTEIQKFQQKIQESHLNLKYIAGLKKESLAKDLNILGDLLINPSTENFQKYARRIEKSENAANKRELGGHVLTSGTIISLAGIAGVMVLGGPFMPLTLATVGFFATGSSIAAYGYKAANERENYRSDLEHVESEFSNKNIKEWLVFQINPLFKNPDVDIHLLKSILENIKSDADIYSLSNSLAALIYSPLDKDTKELVIKVREQLLKTTQGEKINTLMDSQSLIKAVTENSVWAENECGKMKENISFSTQDGANIQLDFADSLETLEFVEKFNLEVKIAIEEMTKRGVKDEGRDVILSTLLNETKQVSNKAKLISHLDDAIMGLFLNSKNSKIGTKLLALRDSLIPKEEPNSGIKFTK